MGYGRIIAMTLTTQTAMPVGHTPVSAQSYNHLEQLPSCHICKRIGKTREVMMKLSGSMNGGLSHLYFLIDIEKETDR
jgi:hypothetical protein